MYRFTIAPIDCLEPCPQASSLEFDVEGRLSTSFCMVIQCLEVSLGRLNAQKPTLLLFWYRSLSSLCLPWASWCLSRFTVSSNKSSSRVSTSTIQLFVNIEASGPVAVAINHRWQLINHDLLYTRRYTIYSLLENSVTVDYYQNGYFTDYLFEWNHRVLNS